MSDDCRLEQEAGYFFNMRYVEEMVEDREWGQAEKYLFWFIQVDNNGY